MSRCGSSALAGLAAAACAGCGAGDPLGPDATVDPGPPDGTWARPLVIDQVPVTVTGDTRTGGEAKVDRYDCAPATNEGGAELVYRLDLAAPAVIAVAVALDPGADPGADVDVHLVRQPATGGVAAGCVIRDDRALVADLAAGSWWIAVDSYVAGGQPRPGPFTLTVEAPRSGDCLVNPIPACGDGDTPDVDGVPVEPPGLGGCPAGMAAVAGFCIDRWEAALVEVGASGARSGWSPYANPGGAAVRAVSAPGVVPQGYISGTQAAAACARAGKRLCTDSEWLRACQGQAATTFPYGDTREPGRCNDARACHPAIQYFESSSQTVFSRIGHPCLDQLPDGLARTGAHQECASADGIFDMMGNLHEWTADPAGTFRGGFYVDTERNGPGCLYRTTAHDRSHWDYSTGFRCCADPE